MTRRLWLVLGVLALCIAPVAGGSAGCVLGARDDAARYENPGGRSLALPKPVAWGCAFLGDDAANGAAIGSGIGYVGGLIALGAALFADRRRRERDGGARGSAMPVALGAASFVGAAVLAVAGFALWRRMYMDRAQARSELCEARRNELRDAWNAYEPGERGAERAVGDVRQAISSGYNIESVCERATAVPVDAASAAYKRAIDASKASWEACAHMGAPGAARNVCVR